jgi:hypothetical protein
MVVGVVMVVMVLMVVRKIRRARAISKRLFGNMCAMDSFPVTRSPPNQFFISACRKGRSVSECNISNFAPGTNHVACMKNQKGDVSASPLISEIETATAHEQKLAGSHFLSRDYSRVLGGGYAVMYLVPFLPETLVPLLFIVAISASTEPMACGLCLLYQPRAV